MPSFWLLVMDFLHQGAQILSPPMFHATSNGPRVPPSPIQLRSLLQVTVSFGRCRHNANRHPYIYTLGLVTRMG